MIEGLPPMSPQERSALLRLLGASALEGVGMSGVVILANLILQGDSELLRAFGGLFSLGLVIGLAGLYYRVLPRLTTDVIDQISARRLGVTERLFNTPLRVHEQNPDLPNTLTAEFNLIDELPWVLGLLGFMVATVTCSTLFIASLSGAGLVVWLAIVAAIVLYHRRTRAELGRFAPTLAQARLRFGGTLRMRLEGHAQLQHDARARAENRTDLVGLEQGVANAQGRLNVTQGSSMAWGEDVLLIGLGVLLFRLAETAGLDTHTKYQVSTMILSISGTTLVVVGLLVHGRMIHAAYRRLLAIEAQLGPPGGTPPTRSVLSASPELTLELNRVRFTYEGGGFHIGPVSLTVRGGELMIIRGGNGSGKTTLMRVLAGLYPAETGTLRLGGQTVRANDLPWYQAHLTAIFTGQHLFDAPYGLDATDEEVSALLNRFGLADAIALRQGRFSRTALSSGQSKRLAMVVALLERRPVLLFDEWDSHQDPSWRAFFYEVLLPELKAQGKIVIVVSHDARRFHLADHLLHLEAGRLRDVEGDQAESTAVP